MSPKNTGAFTLDTARLSLRQWRAEDREPFARMNADPDVMRYFPSPLNREQSDAMADRCEWLIHQRGWGLWALELKHGTDPAANFIGYTGLHIPVADLPFKPCVEIGWRLMRAYWGRGYASEAAQAVLAFGFETLGLEEIVSFTALGNQRSRALMERLGMQRDYETFEHPSVPLGSPLREHCLYRLGVGRWRDLKAPTGHDL